jgi:hypothetical protein
MRGNRKFLAGAIAGAAVCSLVVLCSAWNTLPNDDTFIPGPATFAKDVRVTDGSLYLSGTQVTANATTLNAAGGGTTATLAPTLISNATLKVYGSNLVVVTGGTVTLPSASIASSALPTTLSDATLISNATLKVYGSNLVVVTGGTVTLPSASIASTALPATIANSTIVSNATLKVYAQTVVIPSGGTLTLDATVFRHAVSNLFTATTINGTNYYMLTYP